MAKAGGCAFRIGYYLYTRTRVGYYYHQRDIKKAQEKYGEGSHSELTPFEYANLQILPIPMLMDNYAYLVSDTKNNKSVLIDPGHAGAVQKVLAQRDVQPEAILVTHKHWDHSGGNKELKQSFPKTPVYGGSVDNVPGVTNLLTEEDSLTFGDLKFKVLSTPGHTVGHIVYLLEGKTFNSPDCLFSGDHLFLGGCGRMFEAPAATMLSSLDKILNLSDETLLWPGHEYAKDNLEFVCHLDSENEAAKVKLEWVKEKRENSLCTISERKGKKPFLPLIKRLHVCPSTLGEEKKYNPFLRTSNETILRKVGVIGDLSTLSDDIRSQALQLIREHKDNFKYKL